MDSILYDSKNEQTYRFGLHILEYVPRNMKQSIIDLGSGSGALTKELTFYGGYVIGIDKNLNTVMKATAKYPMVPFYMMDACRLQYENRFDVAFSNAMIQEVEDKKKLMSSVYNCLKSGGRFIAEFASSVANSEYFELLDAELKSKGLGNTAKKYHLINKEECIELLTEAGFRIEIIDENLRSTYVRGDDDNVREFVKSTINRSVDRAVRERIVDRLMDVCRDKFKTPRGWVKDVARIRFLAIKD